MKYSEFLKLSKKIRMEIPTTGQRQPRNLGERRQDGFHPKPRSKRNAKRLRAKFEKGNGDIAPRFLQQQKTDENNTDNN